MVGRGSTFFATLGVSRCDSAPAPRRLDGRRVILVDANPLSRETTQAELEAEGAEVRALTSWHDRRLSASIRDGDLILTEEPHPPTQLNGRWFLLSCTPAAKAPTGYEGVVMRPVTAEKLVLRSPQAEGPSLAEARFKMRILVAEDNTTNQTLMRYTLGRIRDCEFRIVENGAQAVEAVKEERFDLVLMDIQMPEMDGIEATRKIRLLSEGFDIPIVAVTANTSEEDLQVYSEVGMNDHLAKPLRRDKLLKVLASIRPTSI